LKYIFCAGAPGSKWSSLIKNIYYSPDVDRSDFTEQRTYWHPDWQEPLPGTLQMLHLGAYFDPGMEFGDWFDRLSEYTKEQCEAEFDRPFSGFGIRIIKSHVFAHHIDFLKQQWPDCPIILAHRNSDAALGWWVKCGEFNITYPKYDKYYVDLQTMARRIMDQNRDISAAWQRYPGLSPRNNQELANMLGIQQPPGDYFQDYQQADLGVKII